MLGLAAYGSETQAAFAERTLRLLSEGKVNEAVQFNCDLVRMSLPSLRLVSEQAGPESDAHIVLIRAEASLKQQRELGRCVSQ